MVFADNMVFSGVIIGCFALCITICGLAASIEADKKKDIFLEITNNLDEYSFYIDGQKVQYGDFDVNQYRISYDLDQKKVFLTGK